MALKEWNGPIEYGNCQRWRLSREHGDLVYSATKLTVRGMPALAAAIGDRVLGF
jgi:hypothetical protein